MPCVFLIAITPIACTMIKMSRPLYVLLLTLVLFLAGAALPAAQRNIPVCDVDVIDGVCDAVGCPSGPALCSAFLCKLCNDEGECKVLVATCGNDP